MTKTRKRRIIQTFGSLSRLLSACESTFVKFYSCYCSTKQKVSFFVLFGTWWILQGEFKRMVQPNSVAITTKISIPKEGLIDFDVVSLKTIHRSPSKNIP